MGLESASSIEEFWAGCQHVDWARAHPGVSNLRDQGLLQKTIPLIFHQDGVETYKNVEANMFTWASALTRGNTVLSKFLLGFVWEWSMPTKKIRRHVNLEFCKYINFCLNALESGRGPAVGFYGENHRPGSNAAKLANQELCGGYRAVYVGWKGDQKARKNEHCFKRAWDSTFVCVDCAACQPFKAGPEALWFTHVGPDACWRTTTITHESYMAVDASSPWCHVRGWHLKSVHRDIAHIMYLGVCRDVIASLLMVNARKVRSSHNMGAHVQKSKGLET